MSNIIHPSAQHGFSLGAELYQQARPNYPDDIVQWLEQEIQLNHHSKVIDLGAGTGKFIPYLQQVTQNICAVEPIIEMLEQLKQKFPDIHTLKTDSKHLPLASESIDAVLCAQSFHWFANLESLQQIHQVLKPQGHLGLIWNQRDISFDWVQAISDLITPFEGDTPRFYRGTWQQVFIEQHNLFQLKNKQNFKFKHVGTVETVIIQRILSTSFIAASSPQQKEMIRQELINIVHHYLDKDLNDVIEFPYLTHTYHYEKI